MKPYKYQCLNLCPVFTEQREKEYQRMIEEFSRNSK